MSHSAADTTSLVWLARVYTNTAQLDKAATLLDMALAQAGETFETCSALAVLHVEPVLTAHPTEPTRRTILRRQQAFETP